MARPKVFVRAPYNYDTDEASDEAGLRCEDPSLAQQHQAEEADINTIVKRFGLTGHLPVVPVPPTYADFEDVFDFHSAQNLIRQANESFSALPVEVRKRFNYDPGAFLAYVEEPGHEAELRSWGLLDDASGGNSPSPAPGAPAAPPSGDKPS